MTDFEEKALHGFYKYHQLDTHRYYINNIYRLTHAYPDEDKIVTDPGFPGWGRGCAYISFGKRFAKNWIKITFHGFPHEN